MSGLRPTIAAALLVALVSVPAHMRKFGTEDRFVGHVRRYERSELGELLASSGLSDIEIANYGFPLTLITRRARSLLSNPEREVATQPDSLRSELSGRRRSRGVARLAPLFRESWVRPFAALQRVFYDGERGDGFVAAGRWTGD